MTTYAYSVRDRAGKMINGTLEAESPALVAAKLKGMGYAPMSISEHKAGLNTEITIPGFGKKKVTLKDLAVMSRQFATMINSGLSLLRALSILAEQTESKELAKVLAEVRNEVETGNSLSMAMSKHSPDVFPPLMVNMCKAGEIGGFLDAVLLQIAENYEAEVKLRGKVKSAMTYPVVVFVMAILAVSACCCSSFRSSARCSRISAERCRSRRVSSSCSPGSCAPTSRSSSCWPSSVSSSGGRSSTSRACATSSTR